jgi:hypothetical protein
MSYCCSDDAKLKGWPWFDASIADKLVSKNLNWAHMRMGPHETEGTNFDSYIRVNGKSDLTQFNEAYFTRAKALVEMAQSKGVYVEVDVIDGWALRHAVTPWTKANNVQNVEYGGCTSTANSYQLAYARKVVRATGYSDNVIFQVGNETFQCSTVWEKSIADAIHSELTNMGSLKRLLGVNAQKSTSENVTWNEIINLHDQATTVPSILFNKPTGNNEYVIGISPDKYTEFLWRSFTEGTFFHYWRGDPAVSDPDYETSLTRAKYFKDFISGINFGSYKKKAANVTGSDGSEYLAYVSGNSITVNRTGTNPYNVKWLNVKTGAVTTVATQIAPGNNAVTSPNAGPQVLFLKAAPTSGLVISNIISGSGKSYVYDASLANTDNLYTDRTYKYADVKTYAGMQNIRTPNDDKFGVLANTLTFTINQAATVYVGIDGLQSIPSWMTGWTNTNGSITVSGPTGTIRNMYSKAFSAGSVVLGGNAGSGSSSMYSVFVK